VITTSFEEPLGIFTSAVEAPLTSIRLVDKNNTRTTPDAKTKVTMLLLFKLVTTG